MTVQAEKKGAVQSFGVRLCKNIHDHPWLYLMAIPVVSYYVIFCYLPMYGVVISFQDFKPTKGVAGSLWVGLKHFENFVNGVYFTRLVTNTISINVGQLLVGFPLPILFALLLNEIKSRRYLRIVQTATYMPHFISSMVVCGLMVQFCKTDGILTYLLSFVGIPKTNLLIKPELFQPLYIGMNVWQELGWDSIIYFAALTGIDPQLYEAAQIDGAGRWRQMASITLPGISTTVVVMLILRIGNLMNLGWEKIFLMYNERTYETADVISTYVYRRGITMFEYSFGSAVGLMNSIVNVVLLLSANAISQKWTETSLW